MTAVPGEPAAPGGPAAGPPAGPGGPTASGRGFGAVGVALVVAGLLVNAFLAVVARFVPPDRYTYFSAYWSLAQLAGFGVFLPVEQLLARHLPAVADRARTLRVLLKPAASLLLAELVVVLALTPVLWVALGRNLAVLLALGALCVVSLGQFLLRGWYLGSGRMGAYAVVLVLDCVLRLGLALVAGGLGERGSGGFAWALVVAIALAHLPPLAGVLRRSRPAADRAGPVAAAGAPGPGARAVFGLVGGSLAGQVTLNAVPVLVAGLATASEQVAAGRFQAAFQLVRIPLFLATPLQATILPPLVAAVECGGRDAVGTLLRRLGLGLVVLVALGAAVGWFAGPLLVRLVFGADYPVGPGLVALLAVGVACYLVALVVTQLLVALDRPVAVTAAWVASVVVAGLVFAGVDVLADALVTAAAVAFTAGSAAAVAVGLAAAARVPSAR